MTHYDFSLAPLRPPSVVREELRRDRPLLLAPLHAEIDAAQDAARVHRKVEQARRADQPEGD